MQFLAFFGSMSGNVPTRHYSPPKCNVLSYILHTDERIGNRTHPHFRLCFLFQDELVAVAEKAVLRVTDLLDWIAEPAEITWDRGLKGVYEEDCQAPPGSTAQFDSGLNSKFSPGHSDFLHDVRVEKKAIGECPKTSPGAFSRFTK